MQADVQDGRSFGKQHKQAHRDQTRTVSLEVVPGAFQVDQDEKEKAKGQEPTKEASIEVYAPRARF
eukprot:3456134-Prorocentrum_lima.AAC.1